MIKVYRDVLRMRGAVDAKLGKSIDAFQQIPAARLTETMRAEYEIGYRAAKDEMRKLNCPNGHGKLIRVYSHAAIPGKPVEVFECPNPTCDFRLER